jgi:sugar transferase (PEP-CTERM/EpsH1 system associated)
MKTIMHVILSLEIGGMEQVVSELVQNLDRGRFNPIVVCVNDLGPIGEDLQGKGITVVSLGGLTPILSYLVPYKLIRTIRKYKADVVHVHSGCWHKAAMAGFLSGVDTIIYTDHGRLMPDNKRVMVLDWIFSKITTHVVGVSEALARYMIDVIGVSPAKVSCIVNGIDERPFTSARIPQQDYADRLGIIARLDPVKDIATLLTALKLLYDRGVKASLVVVGDGPQREMLEELAASCGIKSLVWFLGFRRDIPSVFATIDIFVLCSLSEGTSITLLEAMSAGKPVVVTNVGGNPAIVKEGINGLLVPPQDPNALADALCRLMGDRDLRERMSAANIRTVQENCSIGSMARAYEQMYGAR